MYLIHNESDGPLEMALIYSPLLIAHVSVIDTITS